MYPETGKLAPENAAQRTICWEENMEENHEFYVEYSYVHTARYHDVSTMKADAVQPDFDTQEQAPHIVFTPFIRSLVEMLTEGVTDPLEKARIFYDFITLNMKYTFMPVLLHSRVHPGFCGAQLHRRLRCVCPALYHHVPLRWHSRQVAERPDR